MLLDQAATFHHPIMAASRLMIDGAEARHIDLVAEVAGRAVGPGRRRHHPGERRADLLATVARAIEDGIISVEEL
ncbi:hypothetical protein BVC93_22345 [Mycobacterium sp. MS1601]|uniref:hypothetical protein n=1 Tax=Mycobacterium sp. MS1601 TaxID=1936029 RepID=UPI0009794C08|nr:hypothetical protein [Mycobacterium sp. MS1601]AQA04706.1 hypothetical protein BVC93_22345 [Mycobacterium sp. MS1601]